MWNSILLSKLEENLVFFKKMYDMVRLVDPINKKVIEYRGYERIETNNICYNYWKNDKICDNCISTRASINNKCYLKLERCGDEIILVISMPIENAGKPTVLELFKNATESMMVGTGDYTEGRLVQDLITEINDLIRKDELTGLYNKRYLDERLPADVIRATLEDSPLSLMFMDIDDLKNINDNYGHIIGDKMISKVSNIISQNISEDSDWAARYGGDEFIICLNNVDSSSAYDIAEKIRNDITNIKISTNKGIINTTASIGIYTCQGQNLRAEDIITLADNRMYKAKKSGKNISIGIDV